MQNHFDKIKKPYKMRSAAKPFDPAAIMKKFISR